MPFWKDCFLEINKTALIQLDLLKQGHLKYAESEIKVHRYNGKAVWQQSGSIIYEYEIEDYQQIILFVPSLINKASILDLSSDKSLLLETVKTGVKAYLLDWGEPGEEESNFTIQSYSERLETAVNFIVEKEQKKVILAGYCMGGLFTLISALKNDHVISGLITIATPWNFDIPSFPRINYPSLLNILSKEGNFIAADAIKMLFYFPHWMQINQKMIDFAENKLDKPSFIEIENWVNDGIKVSKNVMDECFVNLLQNNESYKKKWIIDATLIDPSKLKVPSLAIMATNDSVVPLESAMGLAEQLVNPQVQQIKCGHIGMIINSKYQLAQKIVAWCKSI